jgi:hypothetical protein
MVFSEIINCRFLDIFSRTGIYWDIQFGVVLNDIKYKTG